MEQQRKGKPQWVPAWIVCGAGVLGSAFGWTLLSAHFVFGEGHAERPVFAFLILWWTLWLAFAGGIVLLGRGRRPPLWFLVSVGIGARLLLLPSQLIQENDVYRYVLDGQVVLHGENPYRFSPLVVESLASESLRRSLQQPPARQVLERIGYPEIPTVYPPVAQMFFAAGTFLSGWNWMGQRWVFLAVDLLTMALLLYLLRRLTHDPGWVLLYAWNPLVLKEVSNSAHLDVLVAFFLTALLLCLARIEESEPGSSQKENARSQDPPVGWTIGAGCSLGLAVLSKLYPVVLAPACFLYLQTRTHRSRSDRGPSLTGTNRISSGLRMAGLSPPSRSQWMFVGSFLITIVAGYLPFLTLAPDRLTIGLAAYATEWQMNEGAFGLLAWVTAEPRLLLALLIAATACLVPLVNSARSLMQLAANLQLILLVWFLLIPAPFPWYALPLTALLVFRANPGVSLATVTLSVAASLYYCSFLPEYRGYAEYWWVWLRSLEHSLIWISLSVGLVFPKLPNWILNTPVSVAKH